jgi:Zn-dependent alcohol dehydrogenase
VAACAATDDEGIDVQTEAAVLWGVGDEWKVETITLDAPKHGEVLVRMVAAGMCHSDEHVRTGDIISSFPTVGGHEGAGVIEAVGPGVDDLAPGDHVVFGFVPA